MVLTNLIFLILSACNHSPEHTLFANLKPITDTSARLIDTISISTKSRAEKPNAEQVVEFAETLKGINYKYGSTKPEQGFDCSGFISYVFNHFGMTVPRSSREFTNYAEEIELKDAKRGDLILFTGTDSTKRIVGHMGIITSNKGQKHEFIHSTSGKAYGVTITPLNKYYEGRFVKTIRIFKEDERN